MSHNKTYALALTALLTAICCISARIAIPVPMTTILFTPQVMCVLLCGLVLGPKYALLSQGCYLLLGLLGLPVFSKGGGFGYVMEPSFGYALGFLAMAGVTGLLRNRMRPVFACALGVLSMYAVALPYIALLSMALGNVLPSMGAFLTAYCVFFLPMDLLKGILASGLYRLLAARRLVLAA